MQAQAIFVGSVPAGQDCCALTSAGAALQVQCVVHFLQLPIEDDLAELQPQQPVGMAVKGSGPALAPAEQPIPFADTSNPIMAQVTVKELSISPSCQLCNGRRNV